MWIVLRTCAYIVKTYRKEVPPPPPVSNLRGHRGRRGRFFFKYYDYSRNGAISFNWLFGQTLEISKISARVFHFCHISRAEMDINDKIKL